MNDHATVYAAIAAVQAKLDPIVADDSADAGKYSYRYATLPQVWRHLRPLLAENGLAIVYETAGEDGMRVVLRVKHPKSDTEHVLSLPLVGYTATMQGMGGALTYARRYLLHLAFGLAIEGEDKDAPPQKVQRREATPANKRAPTQTAAPRATPGEKLTPAQMQLLDGMMARRAKQLGEGITAADIAKDVRRRRPLEQATAADLNALMAEIRDWEPPVGQNEEPSQGELV